MAIATISECIKGIVYKLTHHFKEKLRAGGINFFTFNSKSYCSTFLNRK